MIGFIGGVFGCFGNIFFKCMCIDDLVYCILIYGIIGLWGIVVVGFVVERDLLMFKYYGVFKGGSWRVLGV